MSAAILVFAIAALVGFGANPLAKWWARNEANTDRVVAEAFEPDYEAGIAAMERLGKSANR